MPVNFVRLPVFLLALGCALSAGAAGADAKLSHEYDPKISASDISTDVQVLSSDAFAGRAPGTVGEQLTVNFLSAMLRQSGLQPGNGDSFFQTVPVELEEAARVDGTSRIGVLFKIVLPLSMPAMSTLAALTILTSWNDFLWPLIVITNTDQMTVPLGLSYFQGAHQTNWPLLMAGNVMSLVPMLVVFVVALVVVYVLHANLIGLTLDYRGLVDSWIMNAIMSALFVRLALGRPNGEGLSWLAALAKFLGSQMVTLGLWIAPEPYALTGVRSVVVYGLAAVVAGLDLWYIGLLWRRLPPHERAA